MPFLNLLLLLALNYGCSNDDSEPIIYNPPNISNTYNIVDTGVQDFYNNTAIVSSPTQDNTFYGQDASYIGNQPSFTDIGDGTISDNVTGLMWEQDMGSKISYNDAFAKAENSTLGGYTDWRVPTLKELYSLINFTGRVMGEATIDMFIDTDYLISLLETQISAKEKLMRKPGLVPNMLD